MEITHRHNDLAGKYRYAVDTGAGYMVCLKYDSEPLDADVLADAERMHAENVAREAAEAAAMMEAENGVTE